MQFNKRLFLIHRQVLDAGMATEFIGSGTWSDFGGGGLDV